MTALDLILADRAEGGEALLARAYRELARLRAITQSPFNYRANRLAEALERAIERAETDEAIILAGRHWRTTDLGYFLADYGEAINSICRLAEPIKPETQSHRRVTAGMGGGV